MTPTLYWIGTPWPGRLAISSRPRGGDWLEDEIAGWRKAGVDVVGSLLTPDEVQELGLTNEPALCEAHSIRFLEFPIVDRGVPASQPEATSFIRTLREALEMGRSVAIHCRQGIGRSSLIAAGLLVTSGSDPSEAFHRVSDARGLPVPETSDQVEWVTQLSAIPRSP